MASPATALQIIRLRGLDPTRTKTIRLGYQREVTRRWRAVQKLLRVVIIDHDVFDLKGPTLLSDTQFRTLRRVGSPGRKAFAFTTDSRKVTEFSTWFDDLIDQNVQDLDRVLEESGIANLPKTHWQSSFVRRGYRRGAAWALTSMARLYRNIPPAALVENILQSVFHRERLQSLYTRNFQELQGIGDATAQVVRRELTEGLATGIGPREIARRLTRSVDSIGIVRSRILVQTEIIRANAVGTLATFEQFGVQEVQVDAEFQTVGDDRVCPECAALEGRVYKTVDAYGIIPVHVLCRCNWLPVVPKRSRGRLTRTLSRK